MTEKIFPEKLSGTVTLEQNSIYRLEETVVINESVHIIGNGATLIVNAMTGILVLSSDVTIEDISLSCSGTGISIDNKGGLLERVSIFNCNISDYSLAGLIAAASQSNSVTRDIRLEKCEFHGGSVEGAMTNDLIFAAAVSDKSISNSVLEKILVNDCKVYGKSICNVFSVPGMCLSLSETISFTNCVIRDMMFDNSLFLGANDTSLAIQANLINNINCGVENVVVKNCKTDIGITGISASSGSPLKGECRSSYFRGFKCISNEICGSDRVGEPMSAINISAGEIDYYSDVQCYDSYISDVEIRNNYIYDCERGINIHAAYSIIDAESCGRLEGNYVENVIIEDNKMKDVETCFMLLGAWIDGRRLDWHLGNDNKQQFWLPRFEDHSKISFEVVNNEIRSLRCVNNHCDGYSICVRASGAYARGNSLITGNRIDRDIVFENNTFVNGEDHIIVSDAILEDWVKDGGGNKVSDAFKNFSW